MTWQTQEWKDKAEEFVKGKFCAWHGPSVTTDLVPHHPRKRGGYTHDQYMDLEKYCIVLCGTCNFEESLGRRLCPKCKVGYYKPKKNREALCWNCFIQTPYGKIVKEHREKHPEEFPVKRRRKK